MTHTPIPYRSWTPFIIPHMNSTGESELFQYILDELDPLESVKEILDENGNLLAIVLNEQDAQFIVTACNEYEGLKKQNDEWLKEKGIYL